MVKIPTTPEELRDRLENSLGDQRAARPWKLILLSEISGLNESRSSVKEPKALSG